jgi:hypothetical protein
LIRAAGIFIRKFPSKTKDCALGSKVVRISVPEGIDDHIDILAGLIDSEATPYPDYELVFFHGRFEGFNPDLSIFERNDMPLGQVRSELTYPTRVAYDFHTNTIVVYDPGTAVCAIWSENIESYPYWARATPFRLGLSWIADTFDGEFLHGALIAQGDKGIVLAGKGGSGKSTTAFAAWNADFTLLSDDYFLCESGKMYPVYTRAKLLDASYELIEANLKEFTLNPDIDGQKRILDLDRAALERYRNGVVVDAFVIPKLVEPAGISAVGSGTVMQNLAPYSLCGILGGTSRSMLRIKRAISGKRGYILNLDKSAKKNVGLLYETLTSTVSSR